MLGMPTGLIDEVGQHTPKCDAIARHDSPCDCSGTCAISDLDVSLGPLEYMLNTPRRQRVHHATNETCRDRNCANVLIVFDRLFGTFAKVPADEPLGYA